MVRKAPRDQTDQEREPGTIVVEDEVLRAGFTQVPNVILTMSDISHGAKLCYALLLSYAWQEGSCFPGQDVLGHDMSVERKAVIRYLGELKEKALIRVIRRGLGKTNVYYLPKLSDVPFLGHQDVPSPAQLEVPSRGHKEYPIEEYPKEEDLDTSNIRKVKTSHKQSERIAPTHEPTQLQEGSYRRAAGDTANEAHNGREGALSSVAEVLGRRTRKPSSTGSTTRQKPYPEDRQRILAMIEDFAIELGDEAPLPSSVTRAHNLYRRSGIPIEAFTSLMYEARSLTKEYSGNITKQKQAKEGSSSHWGVGKNKMAYFFSILQGKAQYHGSGANGGER